MKTLMIFSAVFLLGGCNYLDTPEQAEGRCRKKGVGKLPALSGEHIQATSAYLLSQYIEGCMAARGYHRDANQKWAK